MAPELLENDEDVTENALELIKGFLKLVQIIITRVPVRILTEHIDMKDCLESKLQIESLCLIRIRSRTRVIKVLIKPWSAI